MISQLDGHSSVELSAQGLSQGWNQCVNQGWELIWRLNRRCIYHRPFLRILLTQFSSLRVLDWGPHFLDDCWPGAIGNSLPHEPLQYCNLLHQSVQGKKTKKRAARKMETKISCNLMTEVTSHYHCCILFVKSRSCSHSRRRDYTRVWIPGDKDQWGHLIACPPYHSSNSSKCPCHHQLFIEHSYCYSLLGTSFLSLEAQHQPPSSKKPSVVAPAFLFLSPPGEST